MSKVARVIARSKATKRHAVSSPRMRPGVAPAEAGPRTRVPDDTRGRRHGADSRIRGNDIPKIASARVREPGNDGGLNVKSLRSQFPILSRTMRGQPLAYLDNASTTQKPQRVIDAEARFYETVNANVHRGVYELSEQATAAYVAAHEAVAQFIGASTPEEVIFVRNATEGINLIASAVGSGHPTSLKLRGTGWAVGRDDTILLTAMEHHSNIVPWQRLARARRARLEYVELTPDGRLDREDLERKLALQPKLFAFTHVSNVLGTVNPVRDLVTRAHAAGVPVVVDAAQGAGHVPMNVRDWDADFVVCSAHKMYGPTGVGIVYGKRGLLETMDPFLTGGDMVKTVTRQEATWNDLPWKFEAGTPNIAGGVALGDTVKFLSEIGMENVWAHEQELVEYTIPKLLEVPGLRLLGPTPDARYPTPIRAGIFSFTLEGIHPVRGFASNGVHSHDLASFLDERGIAIRGGHHCAQPLLTTLGLTECARASVGAYTAKEEIDRLISALEEARRILA